MPTVCLRYCQQYYRYITAGRTIYVDTFNPIGASGPCDPPTPTNRMYSISVTEGGGGRSELHQRIGRKIGCPIGRHTHTHTHIRDLSAVLAPAPPLTCGAAILPAKLVSLLSADKRGTDRRPAASAYPVESYISDMPVYRPDVRPRYCQRYCPRYSPVTQSDKRELASYWWVGATK